MLLSRHIPVFLGAIFLAIVSTGPAAAALDEATKATIEGIRKAEVPDALCVMVGGSALRGEMKPHSDIDLLAIFAEKAPFHAVSDEYEGRAFEVRTLEAPRIYGDLGQMQRAGRGAILEFLVHGERVHGTDADCAEFVSGAKAIWSQGPLPLKGALLDQRRYELSSLLDDFRDKRPQDEEYAIATALYGKAIDLYLAAVGAWGSSGGKWMIRDVRNHDPELAKVYSAAFQAFFQTGDKAKVIEIIQLMLADIGGPWQGRYQR